MPNFPQSGYIGFVDIGMVFVEKGIYMKKEKRDNKIKKVAINGVDTMGQDFFEKRDEIGASNNFSEDKNFGIDRKIKKINKKHFYLSSKNFFSDILAFLKEFPQFINRIVKKGIENYRFWLYYGERKDGKPSFRFGRTFALLISFVLIAFALYYIGIYDIAFIKRPDSWERNVEKLTSLFIGDYNKDNVTEKENSEDTETPDNKRDTVQSIDLSWTLKNPVKEQKININTVFKTDKELEDEGYYLTDGEYNENTCEVGLMTFDFELPEKFTYGSMLQRDWIITEYENGDASTVEETETNVQRPAIYLYMGYVIYDDGGNNLYLLDNGGNVLMEYDPSYIPAFARDKSGEPLFYKTYTYYAEAPVSVEVNELGEEVVKETKTVLLTGKKYYSLSYWGNYFIENDYVEERDGRGLNFDFPSYYGITDSNLKRVGLLSPKITTFLNGKSAFVNFMNWNYYRNDDPETPNLEEVIKKQTEYNALPIEERLALKSEGEAPSDKFNVDEELPYLYAYNYKEDYATVVVDDPEITGEDPKYETKELRVINNNGGVMFNSRKNFYNSEIDDYCSERYLLPLSKGEASVGHLYFDHGLLRLRKLAYDQFQLDEYGDFKVNVDKDVLVYPNGEEFPIPSGYTLKGYSDGILLLEKNGKYGYMNYQGKWIADPQYIYAGTFHGGVGVIQSESGQWAAVNTNGDFVLPFNYDYISNRSDGLIATYSNRNGWKIYGIFTK